MRIAIFGALGMSFSAAGLIDWSFVPRSRFWAPLEGKRPPDGCPMLTAVGLEAGVTVVMR